MNERTDSGNSSIDKLHAVKKKQEKLRKTYLVMVSVTVNIQLEFFHLSKLSSDETI